MAITLTSFTPTGGPTTGGTKVQIVGTGLDTVDNVLFGTVPAAIDTTFANTPTLLQVIAPAIPNSGTLVVKIAIVDSASTGLIAVSASSYTYTTVTSPVLALASAGKWKFAVDTSVGQDGSSYIPVRGITGFTPGVDATSVDDSDFESGVWGSDGVTQVKWSLAVKLDRKVAAGYTEDPGQAVLRLAYPQVGASSVVRVRWNDRNGGPEAFDGFGTVKWSEDGGGTADKSSVSVTVMGRGTRNTITNPM